MTGPDTRAMRPRWPQFDDVLRGRMMLGDEAFTENATEVARQLGRRIYNEDTFRRALRYPFESLPFPFVMVGRSPWPLVSWTSRQIADCRVLHRGEVARLDSVTSVTLSNAPRHPLLCYGANASLDGLARKFRRGQGDDTVTPVITGVLHDYDVGPSAHFSAYGAMPATLFRSGGVRCRVALAWVTGWQLSHLAQTEFNYRFGWLEDLNFAPDVDTHVITGAFAFASRHGVFGNERTYPLEAVAADGRRDPALSQRQILDEAARFLLNEVAAAPEIVRRTTEDYVWAVTEAVTRLRTRAFAPMDQSWREYPL